MLPLCSSPLLALLVAGAVAGCFHVGNMDIMGYHNISYLINASIYLVKGGRLGLLLGVLFHSCRPISVIPVLCSMMSIPNMRGYYGDPLTSRLSIKLFQQGPTLVLPFAFQKLA
jgi:hypothetical protein